MVALMPVKFCDIFLEKPTEEKVKELLFVEGCSLHERFLKNLIISIQEA
jgi:hypothetical protein